MVPHADGARDRRVRRGPGGLGSGRAGSRPPSVTTPWNDRAVPTASTSTGLIDVIRRFGEQVAPVVADLDPATLHPSDAASLVRDVAAAERRLAGLRLACAARATEPGAVAASGSRSAEHWYAEQTGVGLPAARRSLQTSRRLQELGSIREQAMAGALSEAQVDRVADAASTNPRSEGALLQAAERNGLRGLAAACDRAKAEVRDERAEEARLAAVHRRRFLRHSRTTDGAFRRSPVGQPPVDGSQGGVGQRPHADPVHVVADGQRHRDVAPDLGRPGAHGRKRLVAGPCLLTNAGTDRCLAGRSGGGPGLELGVDHLVP